MEVASGSIVGSGALFHRDRIVARVSRLKFQLHFLAAMHRINMCSLEEIESVLHAGESKTVHDVRVFVVNWVSRPQHPNKVTYIACSADMGTRRCLTSVEGMSPCNHKGAAVSAALRFDVMLTDGSLRGRLVKATIFEAASALVNNVVARFRNLSLEDQLTALDAIYKLGCECIVSLRVSNRGLVVQSLERVISGPSSSASIARGTPDRRARELARRKIKDLLDAFSSSSLGQ
ncbi:hypothetical protein R1sor_007990 [Riccia sorocarpa]|uniref:Uncharacterized protein n=1 Tax=Riccia sorocarpa TaxID=122646 RepID=A0ABD3HYD6_9MARC